VLRILLSVTTIAFSLILGAILMAFTAIYAPDTLSSMMDGGRWLKEVITNTGLAAKYNVWLRFLLDENQLVLMFFTIIARIILALVAYPIILLREKT
jgi:hypothetical protein